MKELLGVLQAVQNSTRVKILLVERQEKIRVLVVHSAEGAAQVEELQEEVVEGALTVEEEAVGPVEGKVEAEGEELGEVREEVGGLLAPVPRGTELFR